MKAHTRSLSALGGMAPKMPYTASLALLGFMHITGVPPSLGLWSEILILMGVAQVASSGPSLFWIFLAALLVGIGLSTAYSFVTMRRIFFGRPSEVAEHAEEAGPGLLAPMAVIAAVGLLLFLLPSAIVDPLVSSLEALLRG